MNFKVKNFFQKLFPGKKERVPFLDVFRLFQTILDLNNKILDKIAEMGSMLSGEYIFDRHYIETASQTLSEQVRSLIYHLNRMTGNRYSQLYPVYEKIDSEIIQELEGRVVIPESEYTIDYTMITREYLEVVGGKNATLAEIKNLLHLNTPDGFAITTRAYQQFMDSNQLWEPLESYHEKWVQGELTLEEASDKLQSLIRNCSIPDDIAQAIEKSIHELASHGKMKEQYLVFRSSAWGEDSNITFAGQFRSELNVPAREYRAAYLRILASAFSPQAMQYRREMGYSEQEVIMAVACQTMVKATVSGVIYTLDPNNPQSEQMIISSLWGLGIPVVSGTAEPDRFQVSRTEPHEIKALSIRHKSHQIICQKGGGTIEIEVPQRLQTVPSLNLEQIQLLARTALQIEKYFHKPQDIEFAFDHEGKLYILQSRLLNVRKENLQLLPELTTALKNAPIIFADRGEIAQKGIGIGRVFIVETEDDLARFPDGSVLVARHTSPRYAQVINKAAAIITDVGSSIGHMATIAREFRVPTIVNTGIATRVLRNGQEITVDAEKNIVYDGKIPELSFYEFYEKPFEETYEYRLLRRILKKVSPLNLFNPADKNFSPAGCKTFHDITRFVHEKAVLELINVKLSGKEISRFPPEVLQLTLPLKLILIDLGGGIEKKNKHGKITLEEIKSVPMRSFINGLLIEKAWNNEPVYMSLKNFMSSLSRTFTPHLSSPEYIGHNLAVIAYNYANISLRLGYHFNVIDTYVSENINDNYIYFRFVGGASDLAHRSRRVKLIDQILSLNDFRVDSRGDLLVARIKKLEKTQMQQKLILIGIVVAFTRQLDVRLSSDEEVKKTLETLLQITETINKTNN